ncbi:MAG: hypothetical protein ACE5JA_06705, partial [bacterium]
AMVAGPELTGTHAKTYLGATYDHVAGLIPLDIVGRRSALGFYFFRAATGDILLTQEPADTTVEVHGSQTGALDASCFSIAFARSLNGTLLAGAAAKLFKARLLDAEATGCGFDIAVSVHIRDEKTILRGLSSAFLARNLATRLSWSTGRTEVGIPSLTLGLAYRPWITNRIVFSTDIEKSVEASLPETEWRLGVEFLLGQAVPLRFGYDEHSISTGAGFRSSHVKLDYAFSFHRELAGSHRISLTLAR